MSDPSTNTCIVGAMEIEWYHRQWSKLDMDLSGKNIWSYFTFENSWIDISKAYFQLKI